METRPVNCAVRVALVPPVDGRPAPCLTPPRPCAISLLSTSHSSRSSYRADRRRANVYVACRDHARLSKTFRAFNYRPRLVPANFFQSMGRGRSGARAIIRDPMPLMTHIVLEIIIRCSLFNAAGHYAPRSCIYQNLHWRDTYLWVRLQQERGCSNSGGNRI